ncbi:ABC transporter permease [Paenibacillus sp. Cedars]|uniref:ABC transporter permease n=2 Tax=unclassified Paenibacillus TaxID=185978 RepID=UPI00116513C2|nr:ABC transporter permease [Paenibacillus sp. Cedars]AWP26434.1 ABC transporter [Paenibacillus sp. Cedars]
MSLSHHTSNQVGSMLPPPHPVSGPPHAFTAIRIFMWRTWQHTKNNGFSLVMDAILSPILLLLIFNYLFGGAIAGSTGVYIQFLLPGILILTVVPMTVYSGTTICSDITKGVYNRFRTLPFWQPASVIGSILTDGLRYAVGVIVALGTGLALGFRPEGSLIQVMCAVVFILLFAFSVSWIFAMIGVIAKRPETVSGSSMIAIYPLLFASNILVDTATMPGWIGILIELNPISIAAATVRGLMSGIPSMTEIMAGIGVSVLFIAIFAPTTLYLYQTKNQR